MTKPVPTLSILACLVVGGWLASTVVSAMVPDSKASAQTKPISVSVWSPAPGEFDAVRISGRDGYVYAMLATNKTVIDVVPVDGEVRVEAVRGAGAGVPLSVAIGKREATGVLQVGDALMLSAGR